MAFAFPEGLAPEVYPLAWLVGRWRGEGVIKYPGIDEAVAVQDVVFDHDGGPYLRYESTLRLVEVPATVPADGEWPPVPEEAPSGTAPAGPVDGPVWSTETGYWRISPDRPDGLHDDQASLEVLLTDPAGRMTLYLGAVGNGRVDLASDFVARTSTAAEVSASKRLYGLVEGQLLWVWELAAFGQPLQSYVSAKLTRL
jgi:hypothetical protein